MKSSASEIPFDASMSDETGIDVPGRDWPRALRRIMLYLELLNVPALEAPGLALDALRHAHEEAGKSPPDGHPVTIAMRSLRRELGESEASEGLGPGREDRLKTVCLGPLTTEDHGWPEEIRSMPRLNRSCMVPEVIRKERDDAGGL